MTVGVRLAGFGKRSDSEVARIANRENPTAPFSLVEREATELNMLISRYSETAGQGVKWSGLAVTSSINRSRILCSCSGLAER
jgi:hypothetical protein